MNIKNHPVTSVLKHGKDRAINANSLMKYFNLNKRELQAQIMKERLEGEPILSRKTDGGGYFLPEDQKEIDRYLKLLEQGINTQKRVYESISEYKLSSTD